MSDAARPGPPTFVIIGAMKCGTTSLHSYIGEHPDVFVSDPKEVDFFSHDKNFVRGVDWYFAHFVTDKSVRGEGSPNYLKRHLFPKAAERLASLLSDARLLCLVRHPIDRLVSHYVHAVIQGRETRPLPHVLADESPFTKMLLDTGRYEYQLEPWLDAFPRAQFWFGTTEQLAQDHAGTMRSVLAFLGADPSKYDGRGDKTLNAGDTQRTARLRPSRLRSRRNPVAQPDLDAGQRAELLDFYQRDIDAIETLMGRPLGWS